MQIIEVRNDILKLAYSPFQNGILLSDFFLVSEGSKSILTQVIGIESSTQQDINIAFLKGCLSVDETGKINTYLGFVPSTGAQVTPISQQEVIDMINSENSIEWGYLAQHDDVLFKTENDILKNKPLILVDDYVNYNIIVNNITYTNSIKNERTVVVDFDGQLNLENAFYIKIGEDLKFPLTFAALDYIYDNDLKNESLAAHAVIQDVIIELQNYIKSLPSGYLPFSAVKNVVYSQYEENKIPELMLLKNKFVKYAQQDFLAEDANDFNFLNNTIKENKLVVIDATELEPIWHKYVLNYLAKAITTPCSFIARLENDNSNKKTILDIYNNHALSPILAATYTHECATVLKSIAKNLILFPPTIAVNDFSTYSSFMKKLNRDEYIIFGEDTLYLSFLVRLIYINSNMSPDYIEEEIQQDVDKLYRAGAKAQNIQSTTQDVLPPQPQINKEEPEDDLTESDLDFLEELDIEETETNIEEDDFIAPPVIESNISGQEVLDFDDDDFSDTLEGEEQIIDTQEELAESTATENETIQPVQNLLDDASTETEETQPIEVLPEEPKPIAEPTALQDSMPIEQPQPEEEYVAPVKKPKKQIAPAEQIPVYTVPDIEANDTPGFSEGNIVYHEKYGKGVIEKIMNYGNKTLCSIQFEDIGRRLLDPNLAGLKQI